MSEAKEELREVIENNEITEENAISICLRNILKSTFVKDSELFWSNKNTELKRFINKNEKLKKLENDKWENHSPNEIILNDIGGQEGFEVSPLNPEEKSSFLIPLSGFKEKESDKKKEKEKGKEKIRKNRKRNYIDIDKVHFDFDDKDVAADSNDEIVKINYLQEGGEACSKDYTWNNVNINESYYNINWDDWINMEEENVKKIITPPKIPFNENFRKTNKEVSKLYLKNEREKDKEKSFNIFLNAQLKCLEPEESIEREHSSISENFDHFIMQKLKITQSDELDQHNVANIKNKGLSKMLEYLMSWYFAGFYMGRMSI